MIKIYKTELVPLNEVIQYVPEKDLETYAKLKKKIDSEAKEKLCEYVSPNEAIQLMNVASGLRSEDVIYITRITDEAKIAKILEILK